MVDKRVFRDITYSKLYGYRLLLRVESYAEFGEN